MPSSGSGAATGIVPTPSTLDPLAVSAAAVMVELSGIADAVDEISQQAYPSAGTPSSSRALYLNDAIRTAQSELAQATGIPFFVTRYCTRLIAAIDSLTLGTDFDQWVEPSPFNSMMLGRKRVEFRLPRSPVGAIQKLGVGLDGQTALTLVFSNSHLQLRHQFGLVTLVSVAYGQGTAIQYLQGSYPGVTVLPWEMHSRFTAGLVQRTGSAADPNNAAIAYDPSAQRKNTEWNQGWARQYQTMIARAAATEVLVAVGANLERGGVTVSIDGLSEQINPQALMTRVEAYRKEGATWANNFRSMIRGPIMMML